MPNHLFRRPRALLMAGLVLPLTAVTVVAAEPAASPASATFKRRDLRDEEKLRAELLKMPEFEPLVLRLELSAEQAEKLAAATGEARVRATFEAAAAGLPPRTDPEPLPSPFNIIQIERAGLRLEKDSSLSSEEAKWMAKSASSLRTGRMVTMPDAQGKLVPPRVVEWDHFEKMDFVRQSRPGQVACLVQMLQAEAEPSRLVLVKVLAQHVEETTTVALARRALFDLSPMVRQAAVEALQGRPHGQYRQVLVEGLRYPWAPVADHAAEALVALNDHQAVPELQRLLGQPDLSTPVVTPGTGRNPRVPELVRLNHLKNCTLCHAQTKASGPLVGLAPNPSRPLSPVYYAAQTRPGDTLVRADITFLRQDFSVVQPVKNSGVWPDQQRFDFLIRMREATADEMAKLDRPALTSYPQREAVLWALKELEGK